MKTAEDQNFNENKIFQSVRLNNPKKQFKIIQNPAIVNKICQLRQKDRQILDLGLRSHHSQSLDNLINLQKNVSFKKISNNRGTFRKIKQKIVESVKSINLQNLSLAEIMIWKQNILTYFLQQFTEEIGKECRQKSELLLYIWNSMFQIIERVMKQLTMHSEKQQKKYLTSIMNDHTSYQTIIQNLKAKLQKKEDERKHQQQFIRALVYNLRYKRKQINKLAKNLKICTVKLNEFKDIYLDLQMEHVELLAETRDITQENALNLLKRKQQINHHRRQDIRLKQSRKKIRFQIEGELNHQNNYQVKEVQKLNGDLKNTFDKYYKSEKSLKSKGSSHSIASHIFQNVLEDFATRIDSVHESQVLIDYRSKIAFTDQETDMAGFILNIDHKATQITNHDKIMEDMISHAAVQTVQLKIKPKVLQDLSIQTDTVQLKATKLSKHLVYDRSYILQDYRHNRPFLMEKKNLLKKTDMTDKFYITKQSSRIFQQAIRFNQDAQDKKEMKVEKDQKQQMNTINQQYCFYSNNATQTERVLVFPVWAVEGKYRNRILEKQFQNYIEQAKKMSMNDEQDIAFNERKLSVKRLKHIKKNMTSKSLFMSVKKIQQELHQSQFQLTQKEKSFLSTQRSLKQSRFSSLHNSSRKISRNSSEIRHKKYKYKGVIQESKYEELPSNHQIFISNKKMNESMHILKKIKRNDSQNDVSVDKKYWVATADNFGLMSSDKRKFINDLDRSDRLFRKTTGQMEDFISKKMMQDLNRMTSQLEKGKYSFQQIQNNIQQNLSILRDQIKKMMQKKRNDRKLPISRRQSLCKIISLVYTYAYHIYFTKKIRIQSLVVPLFHYFKIGYGQIKKNDLYLRMLYFLSQVYCHRNQSSIFDTFILFLGLSMDNTENMKIGTENTYLYLKLIEKLSINFRFPLNIENLYTNVQTIQIQCNLLLLQEKYPRQVVQKVMQRVKLKLKSLVNQNQQENPPGYIQSDEKLNVFKCAQIIIQQIQKLKHNLQESYSLVIKYIAQQDKAKKLVQFVLCCMFLPRKSLMQKKKQIIFLSNQERKKQIQDIGLIFIRNSFPDFNRLYFNCLYKFKIKEEFLFLSISRRFQFLLKYINLHKDLFEIENKMINALTMGEQKSLTKEMNNKKLLAIVYLKVVEKQCQQLFEQILGQDILCAYKFVSEIEFN